MDRKEIPITPFCLLADRKHVPDPRSIIQVALSDYRYSDLQDRELAEHICSSLILLMSDHNLNIEVHGDGNPHGLVFKQK